VRHQEEINARDQETRSAKQCQNESVDISSVPLALPTLRFFCTSRFFQLIQSQQNPFAQRVRHQEEINARDQETRSAKQCQNESVRHIIRTPCFAYSTILLHLSFFSAHTVTEGCAKFLWPYLTVLSPAPSPFFTILFSSFASRFRPRRRRTHSHFLLLSTP
jgi:hypothetical protein